MVRSYLWSLREVGAHLGQQPDVAPQLTSARRVGTTAFSSGLVRLGAGLATSDGQKGYGVDLAVGAKSGGYLSGGLSRIEYSDINGSSKSVSAGAGWAFNLNRSRTVQFCPEVGYQHVSGPDIYYVGQKITTSALLFLSCGDRPSLQDVTDS